ncbi:hypothetical protein DFP72DRAFT_919465 [Ephemerocybe angulata]|uniref:Uncharacterized protein n=1 Tax=Ephemerocybe angulata TaxID=980116 RepID=A0A8H6LZ94_9AGAR|nr:hypothetical protein DFP72DRAFT_919465 [Tulosesus angulatus]
MAKARKRSPCWQLNPFRIVHRVCTAMRPQPFGPLLVQGPALLEDLTGRMKPCMTWFLLQIVTFVALVLAQDEGGDPIRDAVPEEVTCAINSPETLSCADLDCLCTQGNNNALLGCMNCMYGQVPGQEVLAAAQQTLQDFSVVCDDYGLAMQNVATTTSSSPLSSTSTRSSTSTSTSPSSTSTSTSSSSAPPASSSSSSSSTSTPPPTSSSSSSSSTPPPPITSTATTSSAATPTSSPTTTSRPPSTTSASASSSSSIRTSTTDTSPVPTTSAFQEPQKCTLARPNSKQHVLSRRSPLTSSSKAKGGTSLIESIQRAFRVVLRGLAQR